MILAAQERAIRKRYKEVAPVLDEQSRRRFAGVRSGARSLEQWTCPFSDLVSLEKFRDLVVMQVLAYNKER
jgi:hypothetical protein